MENVKITAEDLKEIIEYFELRKNDSKVAAESFERRGAEGDAEKALIAWGRFAAFDEVINFFEET